MKNLIFLIFILTSPILLTAQGTEVSGSEIVRWNDSMVYARSSPSIRIALAGGYAGRIGRTAESEATQSNGLANSLKHGFAVSGEAQYFFNNIFGIGFNVNYVRSVTSANAVYVEDYGFANFYKEAQNITFIGPAFAVRYDLPKWLFTSSIGLGPVFFRCNMQPDNYSIIGKSTTFGANIGVGAEYKLSANYAAGLKLSVTTGSTAHLNISGRPQRELELPISLANLMVSGYISFRTN